MSTSECYFHLWPSLEILWNLVGVLWHLLISETIYLIHKLHVVISHDCDREGSTDVVWMSGYLDQLQLNPEPVEADQQVSGVAVKSQKVAWQTGWQVKGVTLFLFFSLSYS